MLVAVRKIELASGVRLATWSIDPRAGSGTSTATFLLVHGLASNARLWDMSALDLARRGHRVAALDLRGHGESDKPVTGYDFATLVSDVLEASARLGLQRPILAGQSLGANLVLEAASLHPDETRGIVCVDGGTIELVSTFPEWDDAAKTLAPPDLIGTPSSVMRSMLRSAHPTWRESGIDSTMANFSIRDDGTIAPHLARDNHMKVLRSLWEHTPSTRFASLDVPALFVFAGGSSGPPGKRESAEIAESTIPKALVLWFDDADHDIHAQHPHDLAQLLHDHVTNGFFASDVAVSDES